LVSAIGFVRGKHCTREKRLTVDTEAPDRHWVRFALRGLGSFGEPVARRHTGLILVSGPPDRHWVRSAPALLGSFGDSAARRHNQFRTPRSPLGSFRAAGVGFVRGSGRAAVQSVQGPQITIGFVLASAPLSPARTPSDGPGVGHPGCQRAEGAAARHQTSSGGRGRSSFGTGRFRARVRSQAEGDISSERHKARHHLGNLAVRGSRATPDNPSVSSDRRAQVERRMTRRAA
jgi:hypothetical protein